MKGCWVVLLLFAGGLAPRHASAQVALYGEFSVADLHNLISTDILYGGSTGLLYQGPALGRHIAVDANIQGRFVRTSGGELFNGITIGPRIEFPIAHALAPYGEFLVGFARYNSGLVHGSTTDSTIQINGGVAKKLSPRLDAVVEFSYAQYYALGGEYNPKTGSVGIVYHFSKRDTPSSGQKMSRDAAVPAATKGLLP